MSENTVVLCEFDSAAEAHLALEYLQAESIRGFVSGDAPIPTNFSPFGQMPYAAIRLHVEASQVRRAREVLSALRRDKPSTKWEWQAEDALDGWICQLCDTQVDEDATVCPACGETRPQRKKKHRRG
ncbi:MAG TPA: hypothetical protein VH575_03695 [Gemmataceae bacterium]|jgi:hypothetical protein